MFPYARECITSHVIHGSFPQLILAPINFEALYEQQQEKLKEQEASTEEPLTTKHKKNTKKDKENSH